MLIGAVVFISVNRTLGAIQAVAGAAASVEAGKYDQIDLSALLKRGDDVGQLARVFKRMTDEVYAREQKLTAQVEVLNIQIDLVKQDKQVQEIVDSGFFKDLQARAKEVREARQKAAGKPPAENPSGA
jgi:DNA repair ATPase RecN